MMSIEHDFRQLRTRKVMESDVLKAVMAYLKLHKDVAWTARINTGAMLIDHRFVKFGFNGCSDIIGQLKDGRFLAVEVKRPGNKPTKLQNAFLDMVNANGGLAFWADDVFTVEEKLNES